MRHAINRRTCDKWKYSNRPAEWFTMFHHRVKRLRSPINAGDQHHHLYFSTRQSADVDQPASRWTRCVCGRVLMLCLWCVGRRIDRMRKCCCCCCLCHSSVNLLLNTCVPCVLLAPGEGAYRDSMDMIYNGRHGYRRALAGTSYVSGLPEMCTPHNLNHVIHAGADSNWRNTNPIVKSQASLQHCETAVVYWREKHINGLQVTSVERHFVHSV